MDDSDEGNGVPDGWEDDSKPAKNDSDEGDGVPDVRGDDSYADEDDDYEPALDIDEENPEESQKLGKHNYISY